jgi:nucleotide-binding universal stress UspA family protein
VLTRILCPVDFSGSSAKALAYAAALARWHRAELAVLHVYQIQTSPVLTVGPYVGAIGPMALSSADRAQLEATLARFVGEEAAQDVRTTTALTEDVNVPASILAHAESMRADLVVLGTEGHSGVDRLMLGSVAERVLRKAACPVVTVPPRAPADQSPESVRNVLCSIDFSDSSTAALESAAAWSAKAGARLTALHVIELPVQASVLPEYVPLRDRLIADARDSLDALIPQTVRQSRDFETQVAVGRPGPEILRAAEIHNADLIVMGVRGRNAIDLAVLGSATQHVLRRARCPVLAVH